MVAAGPGEVAVEEEADGDEFEPHAPTIAATTAAAIATGSTFDLVMLAMVFCLPTGAFTVRSKCQTHTTLQKLTYVRLRNGKYAAMKIRA